MFIDTWIVITAPPVIGALGFLACAMFTAGKVEEAIDFWDDGEQLDKLRAELAEWVDHAAFAANEATAAQDAHARCADSRNTLLARIDRLKSIAASQQSVKSGRIVAVLEGRGV